MSQKVYLQKEEGPHLEFKLVLKFQDKLQEIIFPYELEVDSAEKIAEEMRVDLELCEADVAAIVEKLERRLQPLLLQRNSQDSER